MEMFILRRINYYRNVKCDIFLCKKEKVTTDLPVFQVDFVAKHYEREVFRVTRTGLNQEFISPAVQSLKRIRRSNIVNQHTAVGPAVESHAQRLEALLTCRIPDLNQRTEGR